MPGWKKIATTAVISVVVVAVVFYLANTGNGLGTAVVTAGKKS